jgi:hypothetical protein
MVHASVFNDLLEMAAHLLGEGYQLAAAVLAGAPRLDPHFGA